MVSKLMSVRDGTAVSPSIWAQAICGEGTAVETAAQTVSASEGAVGLVMAVPVHGKRVTLLGDLPSNVVANARKANPNRTKKRKRRRFSRRAFPIVSQPPQKRKKRRGFLAAL